MNVSTAQMNYGKLKNRVETGEQIVYYKRGLEELSLNITNACPNSCVFCIRDRDAGWGVSNLYLSRDPSVDEILSEFDNESKRVTEGGIKLKRVKICGYGEPVLRFNDLFPIVEHVKGKHPNVEIQLATTGWPYFRYISEDSAPIKKLREAGMSHIFLSLNATDNDRYKRVIKPGIDDIDEDAFSDALKFAEAVRDADYDVTLGFVRLNGIDENDIRRLSNRLGIKYRMRDFEN
ncbi:MAG: radical SAM protein [Nanoarchaeota archaeon]|nr:radical SAM protein [Nanoarchaeota archaeon]